MQTLSKEEAAAIWAVEPESLGPKALRDYAMVCIGLTWKAWMRFAQSASFEAVFSFVLISITSIIWEYLIKCGNEFVDTDDYLLT